MVEQMSIPSNHPWIEALSATQAYVLAADGALWLENGPWGPVPPSRDQVDGSVAAFQALGATQAYVLGSDGKLWLENGPWGPVPPSRVQVDGSVVGLLALSATQAYVLGTDGNLWLENGPWGAVPPSRAQIDGNVFIRSANPSTMSWENLGTGSLSDSGNTAGSGANECQYQASLSIQQDGTCTFSGYYENRGDAFWGTAPPQAFIVAVIVLDKSGKGYAFTYSGQVPSAPQPGAVAQWNVTQNCPVIAENWGLIAARNQAAYYWKNNYDETIGDWLGGFAGSAVNWLEANLPTIEQDVGTVIKWLSKAMGPQQPDDGGDGDDGDGDGDDGDDVSRAPLPDGVPTGAAASASGSSGLVAASSSAAPPIETERPVDIQPAAAIPVD